MGSLFGLSQITLYNSVSHVEICVLHRVMLSTTCFQTSSVISQILTVA